MRRREFLALGSVLAGGSCRRGGSPGSSRPVRVSTSPALSMSGLYLADELGYFREAGLEIEFKQLANGSQAIPLTAGGEIDVAFSGLNPSLINAVARGARARLVAGRGIASPTCGTLGTLYSSRRLFPDGHLDLPRLKGKRIGGVRQGSVSEFSLDLTLRTAGLTIRDVRLVPMQEPDAIAALLSGKLDGMVLSNFEKEPEEISKEVVKGMGLGAVAPNHQHSFATFGPSFLDGDLESGIRFLTAYLRGAREFLNGKTPRYFEDMVRANGMDPERARAACRHTFVSDGAIDRSSVERYVSWAVNMGYCPQPLPAEALIDTRFRDQAIARLEWDGPPESGT
jgi:NitT/TauT family transport system substrate-binding protein